MTMRFFLVYRYQSNNKYKLVKIFQQERAQQITCFSAINGFHSCILYLVCLLFFLLISSDYMKDCNLVLMILFCYLSPGAELDRTLGTRLDEPHRALARKNNHMFCCVVTSSGVACSSITYQEILKDFTHHPFLDDCADIVLCCGSNKSIEVFDMNAARSVRVVLDAHTRPAHTICQNEVSNALVQFGSSLCHSLLHDDRTWQCVSRTSNARAVWAAWVNLAK